MDTVPTSPPRPNTQRFFPPDRRPLHVVADGDLVVIRDGAGELLALTPAEAAGLSEDLASVLDIVGWPS